MEDNLDSLFEGVFDTDNTPPETPAETSPETSPETSADDKRQQEAPSEAETQAKPEQDAQERARQAEGRRRYEAERRGYMRARAEMSATIQQVGIEKPDGSLITSADELESYVKAQRDDRLAKGSPTEADINALIDERLRQTQQPARQESQLSQSDRAQVDRQLAEIRQMDPEMRDLGAILQSEAGPKFRVLVEKGLDFVDAYKLAAETRLAKINANRAGAKGAGKDHLMGTSQRGAGALDVPADEMPLFKALNPDATDEEIRKYYNSDRKKFGG